MLPDWLKEYLRYSRGERLGLYFLMFTLFCVVSFNLWHRLTFLDRDREELALFGQSMVMFDAQLEAQRAVIAGERKEFVDSKVNRSRAERFAFNPNTLDSAGWVRLGFSPKQAASVLKYRSKGAAFRNAEDLLRLYMVDSALYLELQPLVTISEIPAIEAKSSFPERLASALRKVDINLADTIELEELRGIGSAFARRIYRYRERLGGFISPEQLLEVYGMDSARYEGILPQVILDSMGTVRIDVNTAEYLDLIRHPYLNKNQVRAIIRYREQHGAYRSLNDLLRIHLINQNDIERLSPYLTTSGK